MKPKDTDEIAENLRQLCPPGSTVYTVLRHVSRSGMYRALDLFILADGDISGKPYLRRLTWSAAQVLGYRYDKRYDAIGVSGCGMDMLWHTVYELSYRLHGDGYKLNAERI